MAIKLLDDKKIKYTKVDAEEDVELTKKFGVKQAPTLIEIKNNEVTKITNLSNIKKYVASIK